MSWTELLEDASQWCLLKEEKRSQGLALFIEAVSELWCRTTNCWLLSRVNWPIKIQKAGHPVAHLVHWASQAEREGFNSSLGPLLPVNPPDPPSHPLPCPVSHQQVKKVKGIYFSADCLINLSAPPLNQSFICVSGEPCCESCSCLFSTERAAPVSSQFQLIIAASLWFIAPAWHLRPVNWSVKWSNRIAIRSSCM